MIEGFKLKVTSAELKIHCSERAVYHRKRADDKEAQLPELKRSIESLEKIGAATASSVSNMNKGGYAMDRQDPVEALESDIKDHRNKALVFGWFAEHLFEEDYTLKEDDLFRLEILKRW
jgi:hypothetical protein